MTTPRPRAGRPALVEGESPRRRMVSLPADLDDAADRSRGDLPWSEWLRGLVERALLRREPSSATIAALARHGIGWSALDGVDAEDVVKKLEEGER